MNTQEKIARFIVSIIELLFRIMVETIELIFIILKWGIKKGGGFVIAKWEKINGKLIEFVYKRAIQTFNYTNDI